jgi:hypothetical protein
MRMCHNLLLEFGAHGRTRTDKPKREILSLLCLPISPRAPISIYYQNCEKMSTRNLKKLFPVIFTLFYLLTCFLCILHIIHEL